MFSPGFLRSPLVLIAMLAQFTYLTPRAAKVPGGMFSPGFLRSPLMLIPAIMPVAVEKKTPNTEKND